MAKFNPPWASVGGVARSPSVDEQNDGFSCGEADLELFNRKFQGYDAELQAILTEGGITGTELDDTGVLRAIQALISAAIGGGDTSGYVLFTQAQARLPIFPEVTTNGGVIAVTSPAPGTVRVPASASIMHRGIKPYTTSETDLSTTASKTYHLRWNPTDGFALKDLADTGSYNPTSAAETNAAFDSTYDNMLVARVVTNSSNVATITNVVNKHDLYSATLSETTANRTTSPTGQWAAQLTAISLNWSRTPQTTGSASRTGYSTVLAGPPEEAALALSGSATDGTGTVNASVTRYAISPIALIDTNTIGGTFQFGIQSSLTAKG